MWNFLGEGCNVIVIVRLRLWNVCQIVWWKKFLNVKELGKEQLDVRVYVMDGLQKINF